MGVSGIGWLIVMRAMGRIDGLVPGRISRLIRLGRNPQTWLLRFNLFIFIQQFFGFGLMVPGIFSHKLHLARLRCREQG
jgi:hypothetical protein